MESARYKKQFYYQTVTYDIMDLELGEPDGLNGPFLSMEDAVADFKEQTADWGDCVSAVSYFVVSENKLTLLSRYVKSFEGKPHEFPCFTASLLSPQKGIGTPPPGDEP